MKMGYTYLKAIFNNIKHLFHIVIIKKNILTVYASQYNMVYSRFAEGSCMSCHEASFLCAARSERRGQNTHHAACIWCNACLRVYIYHIVFFGHKIYPGFQMAFLKTNSPSSQKRKPKSDIGQSPLGRKIVMMLIVDKIWFIISPDMCLCEENLK